MMHSPK
jgi:hypothetical protein